MSISPAGEPFPVPHLLQPINVQRAFGDIACFPRGFTPAMHTTLAAVDIAGFGDRRRDDETQMHLRQVMYGCLEDAFAMTRLPWRDCHREDRGDGVLLIAPPTVSAETLMDPLAHHLHAAIHHRNRIAGDIARLRLRLAVHTGQVHHDVNGVAGHATVHLSRLLEAAAFKRAFNASGADLSLIVSDRLYQDATQRGGGLVNPTAYRSLRVSCKGTRALAWIWLPPAGHWPPRKTRPVRAIRPTRKP